MARHDHHFWDDQSGDAEIRASMDALIRPGLLRAFSLPAVDQADDGRFRLLLDTLAQLRPRDSQASWQENT
ncbi:MAG TPA: hypothetical protein VM899_16215 [Rubellimicrobium sp.]|nr:hypothetical protein [Rubellimicrobium sp.]